MTRPPSLSTLPGSPGGIAAHEGPGHLIAKHVAKDDAFLANRLATEPGIPSASTFTDLAEAESALSAALTGNAQKLFRTGASRPTRPSRSSRTTPRR